MTDDQRRAALEAEVSYHARMLDVAIRRLELLKQSPIKVDNESNNVVNRMS